MLATNDSLLNVLLVDTSDASAASLFDLLETAVPTRTRVTRARELTARALQAAAPVSIILLSSGVREALERFFRLRTLQPDLPVVILCDDRDAASPDDEDELALRILESGAEDCLFREEVRDGIVLWRALLYAIERHRLRRALERSAEELRAREETFRRIIESQADAVVIVDVQRRVRFANPAAERLFGCPAAALIDETLDLPFEPGRATTTRTSDDDRLLETRAVDIEWEGAPATLASLRDISESVRKELDTLRATQYEKLGVLAGGIAHDLNNLLTCLCLNVHFALQVSGSDPRLREILEDMQRALPRASDLTQQLLTFAKGGSAVRGDVSLQDIILDTARFALRGSNVRFEPSLQDDLWPARIDSGPVSQILNNLIVNANQAMPDGGTLRIQARNRTITARDAESMLQPGTYVHVRVQDQGHGIAPELLERVFEPYFTTRQTGNGLGLAICQSILQSLGGHIRAESSGSGTTFHVYLPAAADGAQTQTAPPEPPRVLFMDDEEAICRVVARILDDLGLDVEFAHDGFEALEKFERARASGRPFDAAILDVTVPGGMGAERTLPRLKALEPSLKALVSSASARDLLIRHPRIYGFMGSITKPYDVADLTNALRGLGIGMPPPSRAAGDAVGGALAPPVED